MAQGNKAKIREAVTKFINSLTDDEVRALMNRYQEVRAAIEAAIQASRSEDQQAAQ